MSSRERHSDNPAFLLLQALITGQKFFYATGDGNVNKKTIICSVLGAVSDQDGNQVHIVDPNSAANGQTRDITGATTGGTINISTAFDVQITEGTAFILTGIRSTPIELATFETWVKTAIGDSSGHTLTSLVAKWGDIARSLDLLLGTRWDAAGDLGTDIAAIIAKTDLLNSASGSGTLNDANGSDTIVPSSLPAKIHLIFDISNLNNNGDDFTIEVKVGTAAAERVVGYYNLTSDGTDITADTGTGLGSVIKQRRIDISDILCFTSEQVIVELTKNGAADRDVAYKYLCGA